METKICTKCKIEKPLSEFHNLTTSKDGHAYRCKTCRNPGKKKYARSLEENREQHRLLEQKRRENKPKETLLSNIKSRAKKRGLTFDLELSDITIPEFCPVLEIKLGMNLGGAKPIDNSPSIDRVDNNKGYTKDNIVIVSYKVNRLKRDATLEELKQILKYMKGEI